MNWSGVVSNGWFLLMFGVLHMVSTFFWGDYAITVRGMMVAGFVLVVLGKIMDQQEELE